MSDSKRLAKNTLLLYFRMLITLVIGLYTSRVVLSALGISDYGLYNVVGGVVSMFTFINGSLAAGTQRFLTFELGRGETENLKKVFSTAIVIHLCLGIIILILSETIGLWFVLNKMNFEPGRINAALWVYHFSIIACFISVLQVPFMSSLIAHENMTIYAYMGIYDAVMKLLVVFLLYISPIDRLIFYSFLILLVNISSAIIYNIYCHKKYEECRFSFHFDKETFRRMFSFSGWDIIGSLASLGQMQGVNIVINIFCGTIVNAARGISVTVNNVTMAFVNNFLMAANPQIIKSYAQNKLEDMYTLVINTAKLASYLLLIIGIPIFIETEYLLTVWLGKYPAHTEIFVKIILLQSWIQSLGLPLMKAMHATGNIKLMNMTVGLLILMILPITYLMFKLGFKPETVLLINIVPWCLALPVRLALLKKYCDFPVWKFINEVVFKGIAITAICFLVSYSVRYFLPAEGFARFIIVTTVSIVFTAFIILYFGIDKDLRKNILYKIKHLMIERIRRK